MPQVNYVAVFVAALASFLVGGLWYSPLLFVRPLMAEIKVTTDDWTNARPSMARPYGTAFVTALLASYLMAALLVTTNHHSLGTGLKRGFAAGACWVATAFGSSYAFEQKSLRHWAINAGFYVVQFTVMGGILGLMNE